MLPVIPLPLAHLPVHGGLAVPSTAARHRSGLPVFGLHDPLRLRRCLRRRLCGICDAPFGVDDRIALMLRPMDFTRGYAGEAGLHPHCAAYARRACPALSQQTTRYRATARSVRCGDDLCECRFWTLPPTSPSGTGAALPPFYIAWMRAVDYRAVPDSARPSRLQVDLREVSFLKVRLVTPNPPDPIDMGRILLAGLPMPID
ncbi:hypothetical protein OHA25_60595 (plasmid) [Nonomuraea sp. NBC_00507]|uniref:hypothetical protein n=1 Tax=Nonomuraea sp. NBC_00507 TaxID=2976002 RepID=UPI002E198D1E